MESMHLLQFAGADDGLLVRNVAAFLVEGIGRGEGCVVIASGARNREIAGAIGSLDRTIDVGDAGAICFLNAEETLAKLMRGTTVDAARFERVLGSRLHELCRDAGGVRAYGEMVGVLWARGERSAAARLELLWNDLLARENVHLFCSYPIDVFAPGFDAQTVHPLLRAHGRVVSGLDERIGGAVARATRETAGLPPAPHRVTEPVHRAWPPLPRGEALILRLRDRDPEYASEILERARTYYLAR
jgi:hypothetical protein